MTPAAMRGDEVLVAIATSSRTPVALREFVRRYLVDRSAHVIGGEDDADVLLAATQYLEGRAAMAVLIGQIARRRGRWAASA